MGIVSDLFRGEVPSNNRIPLDSDFIVKATQEEQNMLLAKGRGLKTKETAYQEPLVGYMNTNFGYKEAPSVSNTVELLPILKEWANRNLIVNTIINTRINQTAVYCSPARHSDKNVGYEIRLKDPNKTPDEKDYEKFVEIERFLQNTGEGLPMYRRDDFQTFVHKILRDRLRYGKANFELTYDSKGKLDKFSAVDASTIFIACDERGRELTGANDDIYVQVMEKQIRHRFKDQEMAWVISQPRTDYQVGRYGFSELEMAIRHLTWLENTEVFNEKYFTQGGTTRGLLHIKAGQNQSQQAFDALRREWQANYTGNKGAFRIPILTAEDVKYINMTQSSKDMEFGKWLNYLIYIVCGAYGMDPAEINFPNKGGATGDSGGGSLNEGNKKQQTQASKDKGLTPLLRFVENAINRYIVSQFGDQYMFHFVGGDSTTELEIIHIEAEKAKVYLTINEIRENKGLPPIEGGDVVNTGVHIQRLGQEIQKEQYEDEKEMNMRAFLTEQTGFDGDLNTVNGRSASDTGTGKDGQQKGKPNANSAKEGGKDDD